MKAQLSMTLPFSRMSSRTLQRLQEARSWIRLLRKPSGRRQSMRALPEPMTISQYPGIASLTERCNSRFQACSRYKESSGRYYWNAISAKTTADGLGFAAGPTYLHCGTSHTYPAARGVLVVSDVDHKTGKRCSNVSEDSGRQ